MKLLCCIGSFLISIGLFGQIENFDINNLRFSQEQGKSLFDGDFDVDGVYDKETNALLFYASQIWIGGISPNAQLLLFYDKYSSNSGIRAGQFNNTGGKSIFKVSKAEIDNHKANFGQSGYSMPDGIRNWPTQSTSYLGEKVKMAPYVDADNNGSYNPSAGDYPDIIGDLAMYMILNDEFAQTSLGAELHYMIYAFQGEGNDYLSNSVFVSVRVQSRAPRQASNVFVGAWTDFDLGNPTDDYLGTDTNSRVLYCYNDGNFDSPTAQFNAFGENPPATGIKGVCLPLERSVIYNTSAAVPANSHPSTAIDHYNYMRGRWRDGSQFFSGGSGHQSTTSPTQEAKYLFDGDPVANTGWHEKGEGFVGSDKSGVLVSLPNENATYGLNFDQTFTYIYGRSPKNNSTNLGSIPELIASLDSAEQFLINNYKNHPFLGNSLRCEEVGVGIKEHSSFAVALYPNPSSDVINLSSDKKLSQLRVISASGQVVLNQELSGQSIRIDVSHLNAGIYLVNLVSEDGSQASRRFVVE